MLLMSNETKGQSGTPASWKRIFDDIRLEARITGTEAPQKQSIDGDLRRESSLIDRLDAWTRSRTTRPHAKLISIKQAESEYGLPAALIRDLIHRGDIAALQPTDLLR